MRIFLNATFGYTRVENYVSALAGRAHSARKNIAYGKPRFSRRNHRYQATSPINVRVATQERVMSMELGYRVSDESA